MKPFVLTSILAPTDLSAASIPALRYARTFADRFSAKLTVMYTEPIMYPMEMVGPANGLYVHLAPEHAAELRREVEQHAAPLMAGRPYEIEVTIGQAIPAILAAARERHADFIVMGTHLRRGWRRAVLGSVSDGVVHGSDGPVLIAGDATGGTTTAITNILCPVNFSEVAREALHAAGRIAEAFGARLTIVHVVEPDEVTNLAEDEERVRRWVAPELQDVCSYRELVVRGGPAERVLDCAEDAGADLLVIGAQHKLFRAETVIGTTTERLIRFASCPVLMIPRPVARHQSSPHAEQELAVAGGVES
jgi:nucleotide-binding universal stress UspA family protein